MAGLTINRNRPDACIHPELLAPHVQAHLDRGYHIESLATDSRVSRKTIDRIRFRRNMVTVETADRLCMALDLSLSDIERN